MANPHPTHLNSTTKITETVEQLEKAECNVQIPSKMKKKITSRRQLVLGYWCGKRLMGKNTNPTQRSAAPALQ